MTREEWLGAVMLTALGASLVLEGVVFPWLRRRAERVSISRDLSKLE